MKRLGLTAAIAASVAVTGCTTTDPYGYNGYGNRASDSRVATGAAVGAGLGAVAGAVLPGVKPVTGAIAGGIAGAVLGATVNGRQYYRDTNGYCYYVDQYGQPHYNNNVRC